MHNLVRRVIGPLAVSTAVTVAGAQPKLVITPVADDMAASGSTTSGIMYDGALTEYVPFTWTRGVGFTTIPGAYAEYSGLLCNSDASVLAMSVDNTADWGGLNCFNGYCFGSMTGCTPGDPRPPLNPCWVPGISHRWTSATGWVNAGSFTRTLDAATGRWFGGTRCDFDINSPNDISGDGRFIVGGAWWAPLTTSTGGPGFGLCGDFYAFRYDSLTGQFDQLPTSSDTTRADKVNFDGSVISGYDLGYVPFDSNNDGTPDGYDSIRRTSVWRNGVQTIIDPYLGAKDSAAINASGLIVASGASTQLVAATFPGQTGVRLVRWTWTGSAWSPTNLGRPVDFPDPSSGVPIAFSDLWVTAISDDGSVMVGFAQYGAPPPATTGIRRPFIWGSAINGGVPIDLETYVNSIDNPADRIFVTRFSLTEVRGLSADGNAILVGVYDQRNTCPPGFNAPQSLTTFHSGILYLNASAIPCEPVRIGIGPRDWTQTYDIRLGVALNVFASGTWPLTYQWQREDPNMPGSWINLSDDCRGFVASSVFPWAYEGTRTRQLRVGTGQLGADRGGRYRVVVTNPCGSVTTDPATVTFVTGACCTSPTTCVLQYPQDCVSTAFGGVYLGDGTTCAPTSCDTVSGACCFGSGGPNAACVIDVASHCTSTSTAIGGNGGVFLGAGTTCDPTPCASVSGACCYAPSQTSDVICTIEVGVYCSRHSNNGGLSGAFLGTGQTCLPAACATVAGACCYSTSTSGGVICTIQTQSQCSTSIAIPSQPNGGVAGVYLGNGSTCAPSACAPVSGACCYSSSDTTDATCTLQTADRCTRAVNNNGFGGAYLGDGTTCSPSICTPVTGACCYIPEGLPCRVCTLQPAARCANETGIGGLAGTYGGNGSVCSPETCDPQLGACCIFLTACQAVCGQECANQGGTFLGIGTTCSPADPCDAATGACCHPGGACEIILSTSCTGSYQGPGTTCNPSPCPSASGACCCGSHCTITTSTACTGTNTAFAGAGSACTPFSNTAPCCRGDYNKSGGNPSVQDIFDFLGGYFSADPCADANDSGANPSVQDIFDFLSAYFGGGC